MCTKPDADSTDEIEITPEMIEAGAAAIEAWRDSAIDEVIAKEVYITMRHAVDMERKPRPR